MRTASGAAGPEGRNGGGVDDAWLTLSSGLIDALADAVAERLVARLGGATGRVESPWRTTAEAIEYTRLPEGTFRKMAASGRLPSHGGRRKLFHVDELDRALGYASAARPSAVRRADAA